MASFLVVNVEVQIEERMMKKGTILLLKRHSPLSLEYSDFGSISPSC